MCMGQSVIKQMGLATKFKEQVGSVEALKLDWKIAKDVYSNCKKGDKTEKDDDRVLTVTGAKVILDEVWKAWDKSYAKADLVGAQIFQLYVNHLSNESSQL